MLSPWWQVVRLPSPEASIFGLREAGLEELEVIEGIERLASDNPWPLSTLAVELSSSKTTAFISFDEETGLAASFIIIELVRDEARVINVATLPRFRRRGHARRLLAGAAALASKAGAPSLDLEVRRSNHGARALYQELGFSVVGVKPLYYQVGKEDAFFMRLRLDGAHLLSWAMISTGDGRDA